MENTLDYQPMEKQLLNSDANDMKLLCHDTS